MMKKMVTILLVVGFICSSLLFMASCAKKHVVTEEAVEFPGREVVRPKAMPPGERPGVGKPARPMVKPSEAERILRMEIKTFESENIYFDFDKSELKPKAREVLTKKATWLRAHPEFAVRIEGHCDERGTNEYNLALGERRANAAWKFLNALGISGTKITTVSYGEERPADPGHNESAWSKNRRDEFKLIK